MPRSSIPRRAEDAEARQRLDPAERRRPEGVGYDDPRSAYHRLITENVYRSVDILFLCFATTVPTSPSTIPPGKGESHTLQIELATSPIHPGGLTNQDYMDYVIRDARAKTANPGIKIAMTLNYEDCGPGDKIANIFKHPGIEPQLCAENFATNLVKYLEHYELDGFDVDWESMISTVTTKDQFQMLFTAIGDAFRKASKKYYLSLSPAEVGHLDGATVNSNFDFVALQLYSGFTTPGEFTDKRVGVDADLLAYGAKFEALDEDPPPPAPGKQTAQEAYDDARPAGYTTFTQWRLNSGNWVFEQDQQVELYKLVYSQ
jgi:Glycosyl hydrolases family 18